ASFSPPSFGIYFGISGLSTAIFYGYFIVFCFIACLAYIISYFTPKLKSYLVSRLPRLFNPVTAKLISRRNNLISRNDVYTGMFLILILGVGISGVVSSASANQHTWNAAQYYVGGDLRLDLGLTNLTAANQLTTQLEEINGVIGATESIKLQANLEEYGGEISVLAVDPHKFKAVAFHKYITLNLIENLIQPFDIWTTLNATTNGIFLSRTYAFTTYGTILSGDQINVRFTKRTENGTTPVYGNLTVLGFVDEINTEFSTNLAIVNLDYIRALFGDNSIINGRIYVDLGNNANGTQVGEEIQDQLPNTFMSISSAQSFIDRVTKTQENRIIHGFFSLNYILAIIITGAGLIMILSLRFDNRTREMAILRALGLESKQLNNYMTIDTLTLVLANILSGLILGVIFSALGVKTILGFMGAPFELQGINLPIELIYPLPYILILISITLISTILAT
ncbi:MAG: ABC transporter permease, partial [Candidatus Hodarchaeales archaeon]